MKNRKVGYTLVELIVVIAVMGILLSLVISGIVRSRNNGRTARAKSDMISLGYALVSYNDSNKDNSDLNEQWPRDMYQATAGPMINQVPWELKERGYWSKSEPINSGLAYERFGCSPVYDGSSVEYSDSTKRVGACASSPEVAYVGVNWTGLDGDFGLTTPAKISDNGFLVVYAATPKPDGLTGLPSDKETAGADLYKYNGKFLLKMGGFDEDCTDAADAPVCQF